MQRKGPACFNHPWVPFLAPLNMSSWVCPIWTYLSYVGRLIPYWQNYIEGWWGNKFPGFGSLCPSSMFLSLGCPRMQEWSAFPCQSACSPGLTSLPHGSNLRIWIGKFGGDSKRGKAKLQSWVQRWLKFRLRGGKDQSNLMPTLQMCPASGRLLGSEVMCLSQTSPDNIRFCFCLPSSTHPWGPDTAWVCLCLSDGVGSPRGSG